ncbi:unnamed protein product, partial [marine sediment metagenome]
MWIDEVSQLQSAQDVLAEGLSAVVKRDNVSPLSHWILAAWLRGCSPSEMSIRMPSALASVATVFLLYLLGRRMFGVSAGLVAAGFVALSPFAIWYAQDGRMYSLMMCLGALAMYACWEASSERGRSRHWVLLAIASAAGVYNHQYALLLGAALGVYALTCFGLKHRTFWAFAATQLVAAISFVPWLLVSLERLRGMAGTPKAAPLLWLPYAGFTFVYGFSLGPSVRELHW